MASRCKNGTGITSNFTSPLQKPALKASEKQHACKNMFLFRQTAPGSVVTHRGVCCRTAEAILTHNRFLRDGSLHRVVESERGHWREISGCQTRSYGCHQACPGKNPSCRNSSRPARARERMINAIDLLVVIECNLPDACGLRGCSDRR